MYIETDRIIYSPSDLTLYIDSPFASWMEHSMLLNPELLSSADAPDGLMTLLQTKGNLHENEVLKSFLEANLSVVQILKNPMRRKIRLLLCNQGQTSFIRPPCCYCRLKDMRIFW